MKKFKTIIATGLMWIIGYACLLSYTIIEGFKWYHVFLILGSMLILTPALLFWYRLFDEE